MGLEYIYAALLLHEAKKEINAENIKKVVEAAGIEPNEAMVNALVTALEGVDIEEIKKESLIVQAQPQPVQQEEARKEEKKEEKKVEEEKEEKKQEEALSGLASLFGL